MTHAAQCDAIILACWPDEDPLLSHLGVHSALMPIADRPMLQRVVERLVALGCSDIAMVHADQPHSAESLIGDGARWGCRIRHYYATEGERPLHILSLLAPDAGKSCWMAPVDTLIDTPAAGGSDLAYCWDKAGDIRWTGWARLGGEQVRNLADHCGNLSALPEAFTRHCAVAVELVEPPLGCRDVAQALNTTARILSVDHGPGGIVRRAKRPGVWIGNGSRVHPSARLIPPVFIGQNALVNAGAQIGPNVHIGDGCIVDSKSSIEDSIVLAGTYVGRGLDVSQSLVNGHRFASARWGAIVEITDPELLRNIDGTGPQRPQVAGPQRLVAGLAFLLAWPVSRMLQTQAVSTSSTRAGHVAIPNDIGGGFHNLAVHMQARHEAIYSALPNAWRQHFHDCFVPGLRDVAAGRLSLVGLQPRTADEVMALPDYWQSLYRQTPTGLINESLMLGEAASVPEMRYAGDALGITQQSLFRAIPLLLRYAVQVARHGRSSLPSATEHSPLLHRRES